MTTALEEKVVSTQVNNQLPCPASFQIARELEVSPRQVGEMANKLKVRIIDCQLGCFQVEKATHDDLDDIDIESRVLAGIEASLVDGYLRCESALELARRLKVAPLEVGDTATKQKIKLSNCQLGCFP